MTGRMYVLWVGIEGLFGGLIICCVVYGIQLGWGCVVSGLVCLTSSGFYSGLLFSVGVSWPQVSIVCLCVCARVAWLTVTGKNIIHCRISHSRTC